MTHQRETWGSASRSRILSCADWSSQGSNHQPSDIATPLPTNIPRKSLCSEHVSSSIVQTKPSLQCKRVAESFLLPAEKHRHSSHTCKQTQQHGLVSGADVRQPEIQEAYFQLRIMQSCSSRAGNKQSGTKKKNFSCWFHLAMSSLHRLITGTFLSFKSGETNGTCVGRPASC